MGFDTIIVNGRIVTATDTSLADVAIVDGKIALIGKDLPRQNATRVIDAGGKYVFPGGIDVHTHLDMPFGGTTSADDFETGTRAAAFGGTTTLIDFAIQYKGQTLRTAFDSWMQKASSKAVCDYSFHCIITDLADAQLSEMNALVREGVSSFKLFMAYPGVFMLDDASIFKALQTTSKNGGLVCMHAENGGAIDVIVQQALAEGKTGAQVSRPHSAHDRRGRSHFARDCFGGNGGRPVYIVHLSCNDALEKVREARDRGFLSTRRLARSTFISRWIISMLPVSRGPSMCSLHRCAKSGTRKSYGTDLSAITCKSCPPIIVRFASKNKKNLAKTTSQRFRTGARSRTSHESDLFRRRRPGPLQREPLC